MLCPDRERLASLYARGIVQRGDTGRNVPGRRRFIEEIEARALEIRTGRKPVNLAIRQKRR